MRSGWVLLFFAAFPAACGARSGLVGWDSDGGAAGVTPPFMDRPPPVCTDAGPTSVYVVTATSTLLRFAPESGTFTTVGSIRCPTSSSPFSMAVDRDGTAYVGFVTGDIFLVNVATAECRPSRFVRNQDGFTNFGMAFVAHGADVTKSETLYVASSEGASRLAWIDTDGMALHVIGAFEPPLRMPELTGTPSGDLFGFTELTASASAIAAVDKTTATVRSRIGLGGVTQGTAWAFAFWGGDFYTFTANGTGSVATRFRPSDGSIRAIGEDPARVVGAGVSTCVRSP